MSKTKIEGSNVIIIKNIDKKIVRKHKIRGLTGYPRTIPQNKLLKLLEGTNVRHPKLLKNRINYVDLEYIEGKRITDSLDKNILYGIVCNYIYEMHKINCDKLLKYIKWTNNTGFLNYQVSNLLNVVRKSKQIEKLRKMNIDFSKILALKNVKLDDQRQLSLIHGEIIRENILESYGNYILIDWELATYGDIAYELAVHFVREKYSQEEMSIVIDRLSKSLNISQINLARDVNYYVTFEYYRKSILGFLEVMGLYRKEKAYELLLNYVYNDYYSHIENYASMDTIKNIIKGSM